jgi:hypothetical protein
MGQPHSMATDQSGKQDKGGPPALPLHDPLFLWGTDEARILQEIDQRYVVDERGAQLVGLDLKGGPLLTKDATCRD